MAQIHRFRDSIALYVGNEYTKETAYLTPETARAIAAALVAAADSVDSVPFAESTFKTVEIDVFDGRNLPLRDYRQAFATETFWEFLRGNIQYPQCVAEIRAAGLLITEEEVRAARMENRAAVATWQGKPVNLVQPW